MSQDKPPHLCTRREEEREASNKCESGEASECETERLKRKRIKMEGADVEIAGGEVEGCVRWTVESSERSLEIFRVFYVSSSLNGSDMKLVDSGVNVDRGGMTAVRLRHCWNGKMWIGVLLKVVVEVAESSACASAQFWGWFVLLLLLDKAVIDGRCGAQSWSACSGRGEVVVLHSAECTWSSSK
eukprot:2020873-Amphidinium_carterae.2